MLSGMGDPVGLRNLIWLFVSLAEVLFVFYIMVERHYRAHPFFFLYVLSLVLQSAVVALMLWHWGPSSLQYAYAAWTTQALIVGMRWLAVAEIARKILGQFTGVWRLANIILFLLGLAIIAYAFLTSRNRLDSVVLSADRSVELSIAAFVVGIFAFARYYRLPIADSERQLAIGFCLYSCAWVINGSIYEGWRQWLGPIWDFFLTVAFLASMMIWFNALHAPTAAPEAAPETDLTPESYRQLSKEVSTRLLILNARLSQLLRSEDSRS
jgi:hypothetical protein